MKAKLSATNGGMSIILRQEIDKLCEADQFTIAQASVCVEYLRHFLMVNRREPLSSLAESHFFRAMEELNWVRNDLERCKYFK